MKARLSPKLFYWLKSRSPMVALMGVLALSTQAMVATTSMAQVSPLAQAQQAQQSSPRKPVPVRLPAQVKNAVFRAYARQLNVPIGKLRVVSFSQETWSDTCLGLGKPEEGCGAVLVNGWRVEVGHAGSGQFYRTDSTGRTVRPEEIDNVGTLPQAVGQKVLAIAAKDLGVSVNQLKIVTARSQLWDGCLGVAGPNEMCQMMGIPGWQVIVAGPQQYGVYHSNQTATQIKRNPTTSGKGSVVPSFWYPDPDTVPSNTGEIVFQSVKSGGIAGQAYKTMLRKDGQVLQIELGQQPPKVPTVIRQLTPQQVQEFTKLLQQNEFEDFLGFNYSPTSGADYFTIALMSPWASRGAQYVDVVQDETPVKLQKIIQAWNRIASPERR
jgi:hypothetical protein